MAMASGGIAPLEMAGSSDVGLRRRLNEDTYLFDAALGLVVVADGMGGHAAGEVASSMAAEMILAQIGALAGVQAGIQPGAASGRTGEGAENAIAAAVHEANRRIHAVNAKRGMGDGRGMGTTLVGFWRPGGDARLVTFNVGDSRIYLLRGGRLARLTRDHTAYEQWLGAGAVGRQPDRNVLVRAVGPLPRVQVDVATHMLLPGDLVLLCSDGLTGMVDDPAIERYLTDKADVALQEACDGLVGLANANGGLDNVTVVLARMPADGEARGG